MRRDRQGQRSTEVLGGSVFRDKVEQLTAWCKDNDLLLKTTNTKEIVVDVRKKKTDIKPLNINGGGVKMVLDFRFLGVHITEDMFLGVNTAELTQKV